MRQDAWDEVFELKEILDSDSFYNGPLLPARNSIWDHPLILNAPHGHDDDYGL